MGKLAGKFQGGYDKGSSPAPKQEGYRGRGTMPFKTTGGAHTSKDIIAGAGERMPMKNGKRGRVIYGGSSRTGQKDGTGPES